MSGSRSPLRNAALGLLALLVAANALVRGGVDWPVQAGSALVAVAALLLAAQGRRSHGGDAAGGHGARLPWLVLGLAAVTALVGLQLVPLPPALLSLLSPGSAEVQRDVLAPLGLLPAWRPLTLDPGATALELAKLATWTAAAGAAALLADSRERRERLLAAIALTGAAVAVACFGAALLGYGKLLESGVAFVNPNHLSAFMVLTCWIALGFGLRERGPARVGWLAAFVAIGSQVFLSLSRAGIAAFFVGAGVSTVLAIRAGHAERALRRFYAAEGAGAWRAAAAPAAIFGALAVTAWLALDRVIGELRTLSEVGTDVKLSLWPLAGQALRDFPLLGMGRGAFATVFAAYKVEPAQVTFTHLENTWGQVLLDVGVPAGLAFLGLCALTWLWGARARDLSRPMVGALSGVAAVAAHDLFDFSLELGGVAIPFLLVLALAGCEGPTVRLSRWALRLGAAAALVLAALGFALHLPHRADTQADLIAKAETTEEALAAAAEALRWHPADFLPPAMVGQRLVEEARCREGVEWLNRAMLRNPTAPEPHRAVARCLAVAGQDAAAKREFRLAYLYGDAGALREALDTFPEPGALLEVAPDTPAGLLAAGALLAGRPAEAQEAYRRAWEGFEVPQALAGLARATLALGDAEEALRLARVLEQRMPAEPGGYLVASEALAKQGEADAATAELEEAAARLPKRAELLVALGNRHLAARRYSQAKLVFEKIVAREGWQLAQKRILIARALEAQGRLGEAMKEAQAAHETLPGEPGPLLTMARIAEASSLYELAIDAVERAARLPASTPGAYEERLAKLRAAKDAQRVRWIEKQVRNAPPDAR